MNLSKKNLKLLVITIVFCLGSPVSGLRSVMASDSWFENSGGHSAGEYAAKSSGHPMLVYFYTTWCPYCTKFENQVLASAAVKSVLAGFVKVRINLENSQFDQDLARDYGVRGVPSVFFKNPKNGKIQSVESIRSPGKFLADAEKFYKKNAAVARASAMSVVKKPVKPIVPKTHKIFLKDGSLYSGKMLNENEEFVEMETSLAGKVKINRIDIERIEELNPKS